MEDMMKLMKPHYDKAVKEAREKDTPEVRRGVGLAWGGFNVSEGPTDNATVHLELNADNTITKYDTWQELGQGGDVGSLMVTLEALKPLKLKPEQIKLIQSDTKICPDHFAISNKLFNDAFCLVNRNGKSHSLDPLLGYLCTINPHDLPICRHKGAAGIPRIDSRISLN